MMWMLLGGGALEGVVVEGEMVGVSKESVIEEGAMERSEDDEERMVVKGNDGSSRVFVATFISVLNVSVDLVGSNGYQAGGYKA